MARRRPLGNRPLLVAAGGLALTVACSGGHSGPDTYPPGNLMAPPAPPTSLQMTGELCVDTVPSGATVTVDGAVAAARCSPVTGSEGQPVQVRASAPGYETAAREVRLAATMALTLELVLAPPDDPPVGNLMPPPTVPRP
jgi:hypothetical protein